MKRCFVAVFSCLFSEKAVVHFLRMEIENGGSMEKYPLIILHFSNDVIA